MNFAKILLYIVYIRCYPLHEAMKDMEGGVKSAGAKEVTRADLGRSRVVVAGLYQRKVIMRKRCGTDRTR